MGDVESNIHDRVIVSTVKFRIPRDAFVISRELESKPSTACLLGGVSVEGKSGCDRTDALHQFPHQVDDGRISQDVIDKQWPRSDGR